MTSFKTLTEGLRKRTLDDDNMNTTRKRALMEELSALGSKLDELIPELETSDLSTVKKPRRRKSKTVPDMSLTERNLRKPRQPVDMDDYDASLKILDEEEAAQREREAVAAFVENSPAAASKTLPGRINPQKHALKTTVDSVKSFSFDE